MPTCSTQANPIAVNRISLGLGSLLKLSLPLATCVSLAAAGEPISLKGISPGMTRAQLDAIHRGVTDECRPAAEPTGPGINLSCLHMPALARHRDKPIPDLASFAGVPVLNWLVHLRDGIVTSVALSQAEEHHDRVVAALVERWGKPHSSDVSTVRNRAGATFDQVETKWRAGGYLLIAKKRGSQLDQMMVYLFTAKDIEDSERHRRDAQPKANAKDT